MSTSCRVGECDAFFSHSWHDDGRQKWDALSHWCTEFENANKRSPRLWLDKVCIDQNNIGMDLQCLPIFLAACNLLLIISGTTYTSRLWCCMELFVYVSMNMDDAISGKTDVAAPVIITIGVDDAEQVEVLASWRLFNVRTCQCANDEDKTRILAVMERHPGGIQGFHAHVSLIAAALIGPQRKNRPRVASDLSDCGKRDRFASDLSDSGQPSSAPSSELVGPQPSSTTIISSLSPSLSPGLSPGLSSSPQPRSQPKVFGATQSAGNYSIIRIRSIPSSASVWTELHAAHNLALNSLDAPLNVLPTVPGSVPPDEWARGRREEQADRMA